MEAQQKYLVQLKHVINKELRTIECLAYSQKQAISYAIGQVGGWRTTKEGFTYSVWDALAFLVGVDEPPVEQTSSIEELLGYEELDAEIASVLQRIRDNIKEREGDEE